MEGLLCDSLTEIKVCGEAQAKSRISKTFAKNKAIYNE